MLHYYRLITSDSWRLAAYFAFNGAIGTIILLRYYDQCIGGPGAFGISVFHVFGS